MQSHRTLAGPDEIKWVARTFREKKLPCDALIYLGTEFTPSGWNTRNGEFGWKPENFPDPKKFIDELHALHYKVVLHVVIEGRRMSGAVAGACTPDKAVPSGRTPDDRWPDDRAVRATGRITSRSRISASTAWWPDQGDGLDGPSRLARIRMYWEGPQQYRPNERPFALHRNGSPGMQRYGAFLWSGDVYSIWETLKTHVPVAINTGLSGIPYWGTDIGGFVPTAEYTGELHVRWFQFGTFCPSFRSHGRNWHLRLPWGWNIGKIGPRSCAATPAAPPIPIRSELQQPAGRADRQEVSRAALPAAAVHLHDRARVLRHRPADDARLWLHHPRRSRRRSPAAISSSGAATSSSRPSSRRAPRARRLYLPRGAWFDFWTEERVDGGREIDRAVDLETMPLHVRAGAIMPLGAAEGIRRAAVVTTR